MWCISIIAISSAALGFGDGYGNDETDIAMDNYGRNYLVGPELFFSTELVTSGRKCHSGRVSLLTRKCKIMDMHLRSMAASVLGSRITISISILSLRLSACRLGFSCKVNVPKSSSEQGPYMAAFVCNHDCYQTYKLALSIPIQQDAPGVLNQTHCMIYNY